MFNVMMLNHLRYKTVQVVVETRRLKPGRFTSNQFTSSFWTNEKWKNGQTEAGGFPDCSLSSASLDLHIIHQYSLDYKQQTECFCYQNLVPLHEDNGIYNADMQHLK